MKLSKLIQRLQQLQNDAEEDLEVVDCDYEDIISAYISGDCVIIN